MSRVQSKAASEADGRSQGTVPLAFGADQPQRVGGVSSPARRPQTRSETADAASASARAGAPISAGENRMIDQRTITRRPSGTMLLTFKEAMDFLRVSRSTIYRLMWSGQLRGHKVGSTWRFYETDLLAAVALPTLESLESRPTQADEGQS